MEFRSWNFQSCDKRSRNVISFQIFSQKREKYEKFLKKVPLFKTMDEYEVSKVLDAVKPMKFSNGDYIIKEV